MHVVFYNIKIKSDTERTDPLRFAFAMMVNIQDFLKVVFLLEKHNPLLELG